MQQYINKKKIILLLIMCLIIVTLILLKKQNLTCKDVSKIENNFNYAVMEPLTGENEETSTFIWPIGILSGTYNDKEKEMREVFLFSWQLVTGGFYDINGQGVNLVKGILNNPSSYSQKGTFKKFPSDWGGFENHIFKTTCPIGNFNIFWCFPHIQIPPEGYMESGPFNVEKFYLFGSTRKSPNFDHKNTGNYKPIPVFVAKADLDSLKSENWHNFEFWCANSKNHDGKWVKYKDVAIRKIHNIHESEIISNQHHGKKLKPIYHIDDENVKKIGSVTFGSPSFRCLFNKHEHKYCGYWYQGYCCNNVSSCIYTTGKYISDGHEVENLSPTNDNWHNTCELFDNIDNGKINVLGITDIFVSYDFQFHDGMNYTSNKLLGSYSVNSNNGNLANLYMPYPGVYMPYVPYFLDINLDQDTGEILCGNIESCSGDIKMDHNNNECTSNPATYNMNLLADSRQFNSVKGSLFKWQGGDGCASAVLQGDPKDSLEKKKKWNTFMAFADTLTGELKLNDLNGNIDIGTEVVFGTGEDIFTLVQQRVIGDNGFRNNSWTIIKNLTNLDD